ncbi:glycoside hydrolase family 16 protein [Myceligenerans salitolerans]|uniref:Glycoside hydrolase family 16 protein n=1 Tax=Myceligenerans salitolerans TaxID=1230528 RepID=A0ABS3ID57_9MICO|nr:glycoside hydrolase family 16 protein [Myceligenerans salitolerans]MBO0610363.1 glycoside hydrolase family 16 protein [Myceligenerans salitolerans]
MFDDFSYTSRNDPRLTDDRWVLRHGGGGPGLDGVTWSPNNISFQDRDGQRVLKLDVTSAGQATNTVQAQITTADRKFREGTYAARVKFSDTPTYGPDGDHVVQAFFSITPLRYDYDPLYGELDFEYLPNGGWAAPQAFYVTSWETYRPTPWDARKEYDMMTGSYSGWHDLVVTLDSTAAVYYIDGVEVGRHHAPNLPKSDQTIDFNIWLINDGVLPTSQPRGYEQLVDWVYFAEGETLLPSEVQAQVNALRSSGVAHRDNVPE